MECKFTEKEDVKDERKGNEENKKEMKLAFFSLLNSFSSFLQILCNNFLKKKKEKKERKKKRKKKTTTKPTTNVNMYLENKKSCMLHLRCFRVSG